MERKQENIRVKKIISEQMRVIAIQEKRTLQDLYDEILELGLIEYMKGEHDVKD